MIARFFLIFFFSVLFSGCASIGLPGDYAFISNINRDINKVKYVEDFKNYGVKDYYASTKEFYENGGDCEDYSIAKYVRLRRMGIPAERLWLVFGHNAGGGHAVLMFITENGREYLLDNNYSYAIPTPTGKFKPAYRFNENGKVYVYREDNFNSETYIGKFSDEDMARMDAVFDELNDINN